MLQRYNVNISEGILKHLEEAPSAWMGLQKKILARSSFVGSHTDSMLT